MKLVHTSTKTEVALDDVVQYRGTRYLVAAIDQYFNVVLREDTQDPADAALITCSPWQLSMHVAFPDAPSLQQVLLRAADLTAMVALDKTGWCFVSWGSGTPDHSPAGWKTAVSACGMGFVQLASRELGPNDHGLFELHMESAFLQLWHKADLPDIHAHALDPRTTAEDFREIFITLASKAPGPTP